MLSNAALRVVAVTKKYVYATKSLHTSEVSPNICTTTSTSGLLTAFFGICLLAFSRISCSPMALRVVYVDGAAVLSVESRFNATAFSTCASKSPCTRATARFRKSVFLYHTLPQKTPGQRAWMERRDPTECFRLHRIPESSATSTPRATVRQDIRNFGRQIRRRIDALSPFVSEDGGRPGATADENPTETRKTIENRRGTRVARADVRGRAGERVTRGLTLSGGGRPTIVNRV